MANLASGIRGHPSPTSQKHRLHIIHENQAFPKTHQVEYLVRNIADSVESLLEPSRTHFIIHICACTIYS